MRRAAVGDPKLSTSLARSLCIFTFMEPCAREVRTHCPYIAPVPFPSMHCAPATFLACAYWIGVDSHAPAILVTALDMAPSPVHSLLCYLMPSAVRIKGKGQTNYAHIRAMIKCVYSGCILCAQREVPRQPRHPWLCPSKLTNLPSGSKATEVPDASYSNNRDGARNSVAKFRFLFCFSAVDLTMVTLPTV
ncbi:hypothetical protein FIBSPDRAFT_105306 [Athelia psychrophila]|uniref:Uncharacterized protein n=1 Tax=Athelia psychrophila TaxID=1759441 RepID=A0A166DB78_9AGAM|nr:hypothetical protein FIBSPDRAFT_105306 [Fibularhizoctonia sp. CBS 109695]